MISAFNIFDVRIDELTAILILAIVGASAVLITGVGLMTMMHRQRRDLGDSRRMLRAQAELAIQLEAEERKTRHAIRNLSYALEGVLKLHAIKADFSGVRETLLVPPDMAGVLIEELVEAGHAAHKQEEAGSA